MVDILFYNIDTQEMDTFRSSQYNDSDAISEFYDWCRDHDIHATIVQLN